MMHVLALLEMLTKKYPPLKGHSHQLVLHKGKLQLNLVNVAPCWKFIFSEDDLKKSPNWLFSEVTRLMAQKDPTT